MFETTPFLGMKISFWEGIRLHILFYEIGFVNSSIRTSDYLKQDIPEFGFTIGIDNEYPKVPDVYFTFWDFNMNFRLFPKFRIIRDQTLPVNEVVVTIDFEAENASRMVNASAFIIYTDYRFLGIRFSRKHIRLLFDSSIEVVNKFTGTKIQFNGITFGANKHRDKSIIDGSMDISLPSIEVNPLSDKLNLDYV